MTLNFPTSPSNGDTYENYVYDSTDGVWKRITSGIELNGISDVNVTTPAEGQAILYDSSSSNWVNEALSVDSLTDTSILTPGAGQMLTYNGSSWVNGGFIVTAPNYDVGVTSASNPSTYNLNFSGDTGLYAISVDQPLTITSNNYRAGSIKTLRLANGASDRSLTFPSAWKFIGPKPTDITAAKIAILSITSFGTTEAECVASYIEEE